MKTANDPGGQPQSENSESEAATDGIATELKIAREAKGYSFADLHRLTGLSRTALHQYESGARKPGARELVLLCKALEVSPNRLLLGTEEPFVGTSGVLAPLVRLAKTEPQKALGVAVLMMPTMAAILNAIGDNALFGLATLADEALRARDPETFAQLSKMTAEFLGVDEEALKGKSKEELQEVGRQILVNSGFPPEQLGSTE